MDKCPFCGMYLRPEQVPGQKEYQCDTIIVEDFPNLPQLGKDCLLRQVSRLSGNMGELTEELTALRSLVREMGAYLKLYLDIVPDKEVKRYLNRPLVRAIMEGE